MSTMATLINAVVSHAAATGHFDQVQGGEFTGAPGNGLSCAVWVNDLRPVASGLASTSMRAELFVRVYHNAFSETPDIIDPTAVDAVDTLLAAYIGNFTLSGALRMVDIRGANGAPLGVQAGYLTIGARQGESGRTYRVMTINLPLVINDLYVEAP
jgi:hypothetical protein